MTRGDPGVVGKRRITSQTFYYNSTIIHFQTMPHRQNQEESKMEENLQQEIDGLKNGRYSWRCKIGNDFAQSYSQTKPSAPCSCFAITFIRLRRKGSYEVDCNSDGHQVTFLYYIEIMVETVRVTSTSIFTLLFATPSPTMDIAHGIYYTMCS